MSARARIDIDVAHLTIDEAKSAYIATKGVDFADVLEALRGQPRFFVTHDERGARYAMLGPNRAERYLLVALGHVEPVPGASSPLIGCVQVEAVGSMRSPIND